MVASGLFPHAGLLHTNRMTDQTIIRVHGIGLRMANAIAQMMFIRTLQNLCRRSILIEGVDLPDWNLSSERTETQQSAVSIGSHLTRARVVAAMIDYIKPRNINFDGVILRSDNFIGDYLDLFPLKRGEGIEVGSDKLVIHIRLGDVCVPSHAHYGPLPIAFYQYLVDTTQLQPVFVGEIDNSEYCSSLRRTFPNAEFLEGQSAFQDFQTLRRARHIAIAVSSFSWIASYLSKTESIHVPVAGFLDPRIRPDVDLLPIENRRYSFHSVSEFSWNNRYIDHMATSKDFAPMTRKDVANLRRRALFKTAFVSSRIHIGIARRMVLQQYAT
jgi:hypothetical protein